MRACSVSSELVIGDVPGNRIATFLVEPLEDETEVESGVTLESHAYNAQSTEPGEGPVYDIVLSAAGEAREKTEERPYENYHRIEVRASLNPEQARALRDHIDMFLRFA